MKVTIDGNRYDTTKCEVIAEYDHYNYNNNYSGTTYLLRATDGQMLTQCKTNGQDLYLQDTLTDWDERDDPINIFKMSNTQEARAAELGLITII